jgi:hypothetical protein
MATTQHTSQTWVYPDLHEDRHDFSLVLGGPLFQLLRKAHLEGDHLELLRQRMLVITGGAWLPLLLLSVLSTSDGNVGRLSFFHDVEVHVRFLIALPILIAAEVIVHARIGPVVRRFIERRIVLPQDLPRFDRAIESARDAGDPIRSRGHHASRGRHRRAFLASPAHDFLPGRTHHAHH